MAHRRVFGRGVVLGDEHQRSGQHDTDDAGAEESQRGDARTQVNAVEYCIGDEEERDQREDGCNGQALVQGVHDLASAAVFNEVATDDRGDDRHCAECQRIYRCNARICLHEERAEQHRGYDGHGVRFEQVSGHTGAVAHVVADVVSDHGRIAWVIFRNASFDFADEVSANVRTLGEDAAAKTRKDGDER